MIVSARHKDSLSDMSQRVEGCLVSEESPMLVGEKLGNEQEDRSQGRAQGRAFPIL